MFRLAARMGLLAAALTVCLVLLFPSTMGALPSGMRTPILAFELARTPDEIEAMFEGPQRAAWRRAMDAGNYADFAYLLAYGAFLVTFSGALAAAGSRAARLGRWLAPVASAMDALENLQLLAISRALGGDYADALSRLQLFTWLKWSVIPLVCASWIPGMWARGALGRAGAALAACGLIATPVAFATRGAAAELMALCDGLALIAALIVALRSREPG